MGSTSEVIVKISKELKKQLENKKNDISKVVQEALEKELEKKLKKSSSSWKEVPFPGNISRVKSSDILPSHFMEITDLDQENYERIVDEDSWEYLDGKLFHNSPESVYHNYILSRLNHKVQSSLDMDQYIILFSRVALSIKIDKPEPDLMIFHHDNFQRKRRKNGKSSEIIESAPLFIIEIVSASSLENDIRKTQKYLSKGVKEFWKIDISKEPMRISVYTLKQGAYEHCYYEEGKIQSGILPEFIVTFKELEKPESIKEKYEKED